MKKKILWSVLGMLVVFQFVRPARNEGEAYGSSDFTHVMNVPDEVKKIMETSCFDCHSNHTNYPWYTNIQPFGLWLQNHVDEGKEELNFTEFADYSARRKRKKINECLEVIGEGEMPLPSYLRVHNEARLSDAQVKTLSDWLIGVGATGEEEHEEKE